MKSTAYKLLIILGVFLLFISCLGDTTNIDGYKNKNPRNWEKFDPSLASRTHSVNDLISEAKTRSNNFDRLTVENKMLALYGVVIDRFTHNAGAKHTISSNWLLYLLNHIHPTFGFIYNPDTFVAKGHSLICGQSSYLLMHMALREGIRARHVGLYGHVVMESWYDNDWHLFDPDLESIPKNHAGEILSVEELAKDNETLKNTYPPYKGNAQQFISSRQDNTFMSYPVGAYFEWKTQVLFYFEKLAQILKYVIPTIFILFGLYFSNKKRN